MRPHLLNTDTFILKPLEASLIDDLMDDFLLLYSDHEVVKYSGFSVVRNKDEAKQLLTKYLSKTDFYIWLIISKENEKYIGDISLTIDSYHQYASVGCFLKKEMWGKGIMFNAFKELFFYAFVEEGLHRMEAQIHEYNHRSIRFFEKFGFVFEANIKQNFFVDGTFYDSKLYRLLFDEYINLYGKIDF